jgi:hypothetical protein
MRTVNKVGGANGTIFTEFYGNTTDVKPTEDVPNGSAFYEVDNNMQEYRFDKENKIWYPITRGGTAPSDDYLPLSGGTMQGAINMSGYQVENASELTLGETGYVGIIPHETTSETDNGTTVELSNPKTKKDIKLRGIATPANDNDAVNRKYADDIKNYGIEHNPVLDSGQEEFILGQNDLAYVFKNSMVMDSGDRFYFADPVSLTDGRLVPFITSAMTGEEYHLLVGTYPKGVQNGTLVPVQIDGVATPTGDNMAVNKKYVDDIVNSVTENQVTIQKADNANMCINLTVNGDEASGILDLTDKNGNPVIVRGVDTPIQDTDAVNKKYFETHLPTDFTPTKDLDMKQYKLINASAVEIYGGINDSANNTYFIRETSQASINTDTEIPEYVKVITGVHTGDTNQDVILRGIRAGQQKNDAVNYSQFKTLADSFEIRLPQSHWL